MQDPTAGALTGCLLGQAIGDALGFVVESAPPAAAAEYVERCLLAGRAGSRAHPQFPFGQYTDDTQLARELLRSVRDAGGWDPAAFAVRIGALFREGRVVGSGPGTRSAAEKLLAGAAWWEAGRPAPYAGNGSAMRAAPVGILFGHDPERMVQVAKEQSLITHHDPRCTAGAIVVAGAVALVSVRGPIHRGEFLDQIATWAEREDHSVAVAVRGIASWLDLAPAEAAGRLHQSGLDPRYHDRWSGISAFVTPSVVWSLYAVLRSPDDYWATVCTAIGVGGDTDTMGAIAGAISGARGGVSSLPQALLGSLNDRGEWTASDLLALAHDCARLARRSPGASAS